MSTINDASTNELKVGWLAPDGSFWPCETCEHVAIARMLCDKFEYNIWEYRGQADDTLLHLGWIHITLSEWDKEWRIDWKWTHKITYPQVQFLKPYFEDIHPVNELVKGRWEREVEELY